MTIHASGSPIKASEIFAEINVLSGSLDFNAKSAIFRELVGIPSGPVLFNNFYGKSCFAAFLAGPASAFQTGPTHLSTFCDMEPGQYGVDANGTFTYTPYIDPANTNILAISTYEMRIRTLVGPTNGGTLTYSSFPTAGYTAGTWTPIVMGGTYEQLVAILQKSSSGSPATTAQIEMGIRWAGNTASQALKTITLSLA